MYTNNTHRIIHQYGGSYLYMYYEHSLTHTHIHRSLWKKCTFSGDGEYIVAGSARAHSLYIWERSVGNLVKILHGTKGELLLDVIVSSHPYQRPLTRPSAIDTM